MTVSIRNELRPNSLKVHAASIHLNYSYSGATCRINHTQQWKIARKGLQAYKLYENLCNKACNFSMICSCKCSDTKSGGKTAASHLITNTGAPPGTARFLFLCYIIPFLSKPFLLTLVLACCMHAYISHHTILMLQHPNTSSYLVFCHSKTLYQDEYKLIAVFRTRRCKSNTETENTCLLIELLSKTEILVRCQDSKPVAAS